jgi:hypothetical protein
LRLSSGRRPSPGHHLPQGSPAETMVSTSGWGNEPTLARHWIVKVSFLNNPDCDVDFPVN